MTADALAILRVDGEGRVVATNDVARDVLRARPGARCADQVAARDDGGAVCTIACAGRLAAGEGTPRTGAVVVQRRRCELRCERVGDEVVVAIRVGPLAPIAGDRLTDRERDVLGRLAQGATPGAIAAVLDVPVGTVRHHLERARRKLGARTRAEAVARAVDRGELARG